MGTRVSVPAPERKEVAEKKRVAKRKGPSTSGPRTRSKAAKEGSEAKIISEHCVEDECDQLRCEFCALKKEQAKLNRKISEKERRLKDEELEEQLRPLRRETQQVQRNLRQKRKRLKELCDAIEVENAYQRLDKLPPEVWEKILEHLEDADLFPLALSSRYFRKKQKDLVARTRQNGPGSRRVLKTRIRPKFEKSQPASAEYIRFCSKHKLSRDHIYDKIGHNHFRCLAAFHGHLPLLQELLEPFRSKRTKISAPGGSQWTTSSFQKKLTPKSGLNCGCPPRIIRVPNPESQILDAACKGGQLEIMRWLRSEGVYLGDCSKAAKAGHLEVLKWLRSEGCPWDEHTCAGAAEKGHLEVLKWLRSEGCPWNEEACARAIKGGHLEILKWLRSEGCPWNATACSEAAGGGHLEVLKWLRREGCPWDARACWRAAEGGHLEVLKWLRSEGCPWNATACWRAAGGGHLEVLKWLRREGCPWDMYTWRHAAQSTREWLKENGYPQSLIDEHDDEYGDDWYSEDEYSDDYSEDDE